MASTPPAKKTFGYFKPIILHGASLVVLGFDEIRSNPQGRAIEGRICLGMTGRAGLSNFLGHGKCCLEFSWREYEKR